MLWRDASNGFLLAFPALFSIINPIAGALIFRQITDGRTHPERVRLAWQVGRNSLAVMLVALWSGSYVLAFFGISLNALRIAGGMVVALFAWSVLNHPEHREQEKQQVAQETTSSREDEIAFFPLTLPVTTGPGTISVVIALGADRPEANLRTLIFLAGTSVAAAAMAVVIWMAFRWADSLCELLGHSGQRVVARLSAFLLLCIGVQIMITGVTTILQPLLGHGTG